MGRGGEVRDSKIDWAFAPYQKKSRWRVGWLVYEDETILGSAERGDWGLISLFFVALPESGGTVSIAAVGQDDMKVKTFFTRNIPRADAIAYMKRKASVYGWVVEEE